MNCVNANNMNTYMMFVEEMRTEKEGTTKKVKTLSLVINAIQIQHINPNLSIQTIYHYDLTDK